MSGQDVVRARDLMLVFWTDSTLRRMPRPDLFVAEMRARAVFDTDVPAQWGKDSEYVAAIIPSQDEEFTCDKAKEIK